MSNGIKRLIIILCALGLCTLAVAFSGINIKKTGDNELNGFDIFQTFKNGNIVFIENNGAKGYADSKGEIILKAKWTYIKPISDNRFIVTEAGNSHMGIIDSNEEVISPFIYEKFDNLSDILLVGYTFDKGKLFLLNSDGNRYANDEWDLIDYKNDNDFNLTKDSSVYSCSICENRLIIKNIAIKKNVLGNDVSINFVPNETIPQIPFNTYEKLTDLSISFVLGLFNNDRDSLKKICTEDFYHYLNKYNNYKKFSIIELTYINPQIEKEDNNSLTYHSIVKISYNDEDFSAVSEEIQVNFIADDKGNLLVTNIEA